jgi:hypothetical protein
MKSLTFSFFVLLVLFTACAETQTATETEAENKQTEAVALNNADFSAIQGEVTEAEGMPQVTVLIRHKSGAEAEFTTENAFTEIAPDQRAGYKIPNEVAFSFSTYYAGAGYLYFAVVENNLLNVYRRFYGEESVEETFELFKSFQLTDNNLTVVE